MELGQPLDRSFFARDAATVARDLLGCLLVRRQGGRETVVRIVETEAYVGAHDLACHASKGRTPRTEVMFGTAGFAYVYFVYGMHHLLNVVTGPQDDPQAVLLRGAEPWPAPQGNRTLAGPAKLCKTLDITTREHNRLDVCSGGAISFRARPTELAETVVATERVGVDYAGAWAREPLRFLLEGSPGISKPA
ncbi:MAG TPA: DNA-3-methyladenine glycosylase [Fibrobacteria bacterium]|nr:DNA-3-methyladenine glycosylase [Fibrobacteria bacterium]